MSFVYLIVNWPSPDGCQFQGTGTDDVTRESASPAGRARPADATEHVIANKTGMAESCTNRSLQDIPFLDIKQTFFNQRPYRLGVARDVTCCDRYAYDTSYVELLPWSLWHLICSRSALQGILKSPATTNTTFLPTPTSWSPTKGKNSLQIRVFRKCHDMLPFHSRTSFTNANREKGPWNFNIPVQHVRFAYS